MICRVCDEPESDQMYHGFAMHKPCAPAHWVKDHADRDEFFVRFRAWWKTASRWKRNWDGLRD